MTDIPPQDDPLLEPIEVDAARGDTVVAEAAGEPEPPIVLAEPPVAEVRPRVRSKRKRGLIRRMLLIALVVLVAGPVAMTLVYRFVPPPATILMLLRAAEGHGLDYRWRGLDDISPALVQAAIASEDSGFCRHHGFDFSAMQKAFARDQAHPKGKIRGGSTISQQTAKNVFLWPDRTYVRKGLEAYFTVLTELIWGKRRIMEMYLNVVEMGPGIYGAEAASQHYFGHSARTLDRTEADHLVAILPDPLKWKAVGSGPYVQRRSARIGARIGVVRMDGLAACVAR